MLRCRFSCLEDADDLFFRSILISCSLHLVLQIHVDFLFSISVFVVNPSIGSASLDSWLSWP